MKKIIVSLASLALISWSVFFINKLLNPSEEIVLEKQTTELNAPYSLFKSGEKYNTYVLKEEDTFSYIIEDINIKYENNILNINDKTIEYVDKISNYITIFAKSIIIIGYKTSDKLEHILIYNTYIDDFNILDNINNFNVLIDKIIIEDEGIIINTSKIMDNKLIGSDISICDIKDKNMKVLATYEYYYDENEKVFNKFEELFSNNLYSYLLNNSACK